MEEVRQYTMVITCERSFAYCFAHFDALFLGILGLVYDRRSGQLSIRKPLASFKIDISIIRTVEMGDK